MAQTDDESKKKAVHHTTQVVISLPPIKAPRFLQGFVDFIREQGVVGLAVGLILGLAAQKLINSLVTNIVNPVVGLLTGGVSLEHKTYCIKHTGSSCATTLAYGQFLSDFITFFIIAAIVYFVVKGLKLERLDKKKENK